jgi:hypothetical protein
MYAVNGLSSTTCNIQFEDNTEVMRVRMFLLWLI